METSAAVEARIRERVASLERLTDRITSCHVTLEAPHRHQQQGNLFEVHVDLHLPERQLAFGRARHRDQAHEDVYVAIRDTFAAAERGVEAYVRDHRLR